MTEEIINIEVPVKITKRKKWFLCSVVEQDIYAQGYTEDEAKKNMKETLTILWHLDN